jgi:hypothetical protein
MNEKILRLLTNLSADERFLLNTRFLAPCVRRGKVQTRLQGLTYTFTSRPEDYEGWGVFSPVSVSVAKLSEEPGLPLVFQYLSLFKFIRARLAYRLRGRTWLAYPMNDSDAMQRLGSIRPFAVHLVADGTQFESVTSRYDGNAFWFESIDRSADPLIDEQLRNDLKRVTSPQQLRFKGLTPEMRATYELAFQQTAEFRRKETQHRDQTRLREALQVAGGELTSFRDRGRYWTVHWTTSRGEQLTSAISKSDLTVISSGICLSGRDRDFDLTSLVGVIEHRDW